MDSISLENSFTYLHVSEIKLICKTLNLSVLGNKMRMIKRIIHFLKTGEKISTPKYPESSKAINNKKHRIEPNSLMLKGRYKNDLQNRLFFKKIIGDFFHFTAFGIDWLEQKWLDGSPPTYQEFADMWIKEYQIRQKYGRNPKAEWAYINFIKRYLIENPSAKRGDIIEQWNIERLKHKGLINKILNVQYSL